jgi:hypothetical protein
MTMTRGSRDGADDEAEGNCVVAALLGVDGRTTILLGLEPSGRP